MVKLTKCVWSVALVLALFCIGSLVADMQALQNNVIRMHIVANSDSCEDQNLKLKVRDAVCAYLNSEMTGINNIDEARLYLCSNLDNILGIVNETLEENKHEANAHISLRKESFDTRHYETFSLPAGVYESLRIEIGEGNGQNWWCVVFPSLCVPNVTEAFSSAAVSSGFDQSVSDTISAEDGYEIRFFLLECLGKLQNFFYFA